MAHSQTPWIFYAQQYGRYEVSDANGLALQDNRGERTLQFDDMQRAIYCTNFCEGIPNDVLTAESKPVEHLLALACLQGDDTASHALADAVIEKARGEVPITVGDVVLARGHVWYDTDDGEWHRNTIRHLAVVAAIYKDGARYSLICVADIYSSILRPMDGYSREDLTRIGRLPDWKG